jgi:arylsulfatase
MTGLLQGDLPMLLDASYTITADIDVPQGDAEGMIVASGGRFAGYGFYLLKGKPVFLWNLIDLKRVKWKSPDALTPGKHIVEFDFKYDGLGIGTLAFNNMSGLGRPGTGTLQGGWQGSPNHHPAAHVADDSAMGRELRLRL